MTDHESGDSLFRAMVEKVGTLDDAQAHAMLATLMQNVRDEQTRIADAMEVRTQQISDIENKIDRHAEESNIRHAQILSAFPSDDTEGHRRYHDEIIKRMELRNDIVRDCLKKIAQAGIVGGLLWLGKAIYYYAFK